MRPIYEIANEIFDDWGDKISPHARPYLLPMATLDSFESTFGLDDAEYIVLYFLSNATTWRGDVARRVKAELKAGLKEYKKSRGR